MITMEGSTAVEARERGSAGDRAGERTFARLLDRRALDSAYRYATLVLGDRAEAEDATHDAALSAWRKLSDLRDPERFDAWFGRILVNACRDRLRARRRIPRATPHAGTARFEPADLRELELEAGGSAAWDDPAERFARRDALGAALRSLSVDHREVVVLRFWADLTVDQIAERTGVRVGTVKSRLHYALRELRGAIGADDGRYER